MTDKTPKLLVDALGAIDSAREFVAGISFADYADDKMRRSAVERQLEILGEACARLAKLEPALAGSVVNLKLAIDLRNRIIHGYDSVDDEIVYLTVVGDLAELRGDLSRLLTQRDGLVNETPGSALPTRPAGGSSPLDAGRPGGGLRRAGL